MRLSGERLGPLAGAALAIAVGAACASLLGQEAIPRCAPESVRPPVTAACADDPEARAFLDGLEESVGAAAGGTRVRGSLDGYGRLEAFCAVGPPVPSDWRDRVAVQEALAGLEDPGSGPTCVAARTFELNRFRSRVVAMEAEVEECRRLSQRNRQNRLGPLAGMRQCLTDRQRAADELWVFNRGYAKPLPFVRSRPDADRRTATQSCAGRDVQLSRTRFLETVAVAPPGPELEACLAGEGWVPYR